jgi:hypothetical protein
MTTQMIFSKITKQKTTLRVFSKTTVNLRQSAHLTQNWCSQDTSTKCFQTSVLKGPWRIRMESRKWAITSFLWLAALVTKYSLGPQVITSCRCLSLQLSLTLSVLLLCYTASTRSQYSIKSSLIFMTIARWQCKISPFSAITWRYSKEHKTLDFLKWKFGFTFKK